MKTPDWQPIELGTFEGFKLVLSFESEHISPRHHFTNQCGWSEEQYSEIKNYYWFVAKVTAYKGKIECGSAYLGGNCYKNKSDVLGNWTISTLLSGYGPQLIGDAIHDAQQNLEIN